MHRKLFLSSATIGSLGLVYFKFIQKFGNGLGPFGHDHVAACATLDSEPMPENKGLIADGKKLNLLSAQIFMRHGARTPLLHIPGVEEVSYDHSMLLGGKDPEAYRAALTQYTDIPIAITCNGTNGRPTSVLDVKYRKVLFKGGMRAGVLTSVGRDQAYDLGRRLRHKYIHQYNLINTHFQPADVFTRSTNVDRTIDTLQCVLAGMYGKEAFKEPVQIEVSLFDHEYLFPNTKFCPTLRDNFTTVAKSIQEEPAWKIVADKIRNVVGKDADIDMMTWRDHIFARRVHGLHIPQFMLDLEPEIKAAATLVLDAYMAGYKQDLLSVSVGRLLNEVKVNLQNSAAHKPDIPKLYLYSCHDSTILPVLKSLRIFDNQWPPYCAAVEIELLEDQQHQQYVRVVYLDQEQDVLGNGQALVPLNQFYKLISKYSRTYEEMLRECKYSKKDSKEDVLLIAKNM